MARAANNRAQRTVAASRTNFGAPWIVGSHQLAEAWAGASHRMLHFSAPRLAGVKLLGNRAHSNLPAHLPNSKVGLLPLNARPANAGRSPIEICEYAAACLPVLAARTPELAHMYETFVRFLDPSNPTIALDDMFDGLLIPDPSHVASRDGSKIAQAMLDLSMSSRPVAPARAASAKAGA